MDIDSILKNAALAHADGGYERKLINKLNELSNINKISLPSNTKSARVVWELKNVKMKTFSPDHFLVPPLM